MPGERAHNPYRKISVPKSQSAYRMSRNVNAARSAVRRTPARPTQQAKNPRPTARLDSPKVRSSTRVQKTSQAPAQPQPVGKVVPVQPEPAPTPAPNPVVTFVETSPQVQTGPQTSRKKQSQLLSEAGTKLESLRSSIQQLGSQAKENAKPWLQKKFSHLKQLEWKTFVSPKHPNFGYSLSVALFIFGSTLVTQTYMTNQRLERELAAVLGAQSSTQPASDGQTTNTVVSNTGHTRVVPDETQPSGDYLAQHQVPDNQLRYIGIPSLGVFSTVGSVGLTPEGAIDTPRSIWNTSWYDKSALPTDDTGAMFVVGHYSGPTTLGVFAKLANASVGEVIQIQQGDGTEASFKIEEVETTPLDQVDMNKALSPYDPDKLGLNLMTCGGDFNYDDWQYSERTLIRTSKI